MALNLQYLPYPGNAQRDILRKMPTCHKVSTMVNPCKITPGLKDDFQFIEQSDPNLVTDLKRRLLLEESLALGTCHLALIDATLVGYAIFDYRLFGYGFISELWAIPNANTYEVRSALLHHLLSICQSPRLFTATDESDTTRTSMLTALGFQTSGIIYNIDPTPRVILVKELP